VADEADLPEGTGMHGSFKQIQGELSDDRV